MVSQGGYSRRFHREGIHERVLAMVSQGGYSRWLHGEGTHKRVLTTVSRGGYSRRFHGASCDDGFTQATSRDVFYRAGSVTNGYSTLNTVESVVKGIIRVTK